LAAGFFAVAFAPFVLTGAALVRRSESSSESDSSS
jgi:hypothetical protein